MGSLFGGAGGPCPLWWRVVVAIALHGCGDPPHFLWLWWSRFPSLAVEVTVALPPFGPLVVVVALPPLSRTTSAILLLSLDWLDWDAFQLSRVFFGATNPTDSTLHMFLGTPSSRLFPPPLARTPTARAHSKPQMRAFKSS